jgi:predicted Zn finger-like uncharacterized protein
MIITCASCLTKFNLDDSRIPAKGTKVRCSRCQHVFFIVPPQETREEVDENFESFAKYYREELIGPEEKEGGDEKFESFVKPHKELPKPEEKEEEFPEFTAPLKFEKEPRAVEEKEEEETFLFSEKASSGKGMKAVPSVEREPEVKVSKPKKMVEKERRGLSFSLVLVVVLILLVLGAFYYFWTRGGSAGQISTYLEYPIGKVTELWKQILGTEKKGLTIGDYKGYMEEIGGFSLYIIEGKVNNQSGFTKKFVKVKVAIFDQNKVKVAEKETLCGPIIDREELKTLPANFFVGEIVIRPKTQEEMIVPSGKTIPFMVIFKHLSSQAKEFTVDIVEAPNL